MKLWLKYLLGILLGIISFFVIPVDNPTVQQVVSFLTEVFTRFGRYAILPLLVSSASIAVFKLRDENLVFKTSFWIVAVVVISSAFLTLLGVLIAALVKLPPLPINIERGSEEVVLSVKDLFLSLFPYNSFEVFHESTFLLPVFVFAGLFGGACTGDKIASRQTVQLLDSLSKVCYAMMSFFFEIIAVGMIAFSCYWCMDFSRIMAAKDFVPIVIMLSLLLLFIAFVAYPLVLKLVCHDPHPYKVLYASICSFFVAFFTGDTNLTLYSNMRHGKESLGIKRRTNAVVYPLLSIFGRGGAALVVSVSFIVILRSYVDLSISVKDIVWIGLNSYILSFLLCGFSKGGPYIALTILCSMYGKGFASGYLLFKNVAPIICAYAAGIDAISAMFGSYIVSVKVRTIEHKTVKQFI